MIKKEFTKSFNSWAHTLKSSYIGRNSSGWVIEGDIQEDYYRWVNDFEARHEVYGKVWGNFESVVYAYSEEGYNHFIENHPPEEWDYYDI